jgi:DNA repair protein RecO (recombination protein O)
LEALDIGEDPAITTHYYELHLLDLIGFRPELFECVECGKEIIEQNQYLSGELGGVVCPDCINQVARGTIRPVSARILKYMRHFQRSSLQSLLKVELPDEVREGLERTIQFYLTHTLEGQLNSPAFIKRVKGNSN